MTGRVILTHLGTGASMTAVRDGKSIKGIYLKQQLKDKLIDHKQYMPEIRNWKWNVSK